MGRSSGTVEWDGRVGRPSGTVEWDGRVIRVIRAIRVPDTATVPLAVEAGGNHAHDEAPRVTDTAKETERERA